MPHKSAVSTHTHLHPDKQEELLKVKDTFQLCKTPMKGVKWGQGGVSPGVSPGVIWPQFQRFPTPAVNLCLA